MEDTIHTVPLWEGDERFMASLRGRGGPIDSSRLSNWCWCVESGGIQRSLISDQSSMQMVSLFVLTSSSLQPPTVLSTSSQKREPEQKLQVHLREGTCREGLTPGRRKRGLRPCFGLFFSPSELGNLDASEVRLRGKEQCHVGSQRALAFH